jgi:phosphate:Na+ symporter
LITALFLPLYLPFIENVVMGGVDPNLQTPGGTFPYMTAAIAAVHTVFNIVTALLFIPFVTAIARVLERLFKPKPKPQKAHVTHLDFNLVSSPFIAMEQSRYEIERTDERVRTMLDDLRTVITNRKVGRDVIDKIFQCELTLDEIQIEVTRFLTDLLAEELSHDVANEARAQLRLADEFESVSDYVANVLKLYLRLRDAGVELTVPQQEELLGLHDVIVGYYDHVHEGLPDPTRDVYLPTIRQHSLSVTDEIRDLRDRHWNRLSEETVDPLISTTYMDIANAYRRMKDHLLNIGEAAVGGKIRPRQRTETPDEVVAE